MEQFCNNCQYPISSESKYCSHCGQKNVEGRVTVRSLISDFIEVFFNLDNQFFRTLRALFIPGKLTNEYFRGRIKRYFNPIRLFFVLGIVFLIAVGNIAKTAEEDFSSQLEQGLSQSYGFQLAVEQADSIYQDLVDQDQDTVGHYLLNKFVSELQESPLHQADSINLKDFVSLFNQEEVTIARKDIYDMSIDTLYKTYEIEGFKNRLFVRQQIRFLKSGSQYISFLIGNSLWSILLFMPVLALMLKLLYIRRGHYYVEHLIFSFHVHSMFFLIGAVGLILVSLYGPAFLGILFPVFIVYYLMSIKRVYKQNWWKTFFKGVLTSLFYMIFFGLFFVALSLISFLIF